MLSFGVMSAGKVSYYLDLSGEDYYTNGAEPDGEWYGEGAKALGLTGIVQPSHLRCLFHGMSPETGRPLTQRQNQERRAEHRAGWDITFSPSKSVSVYWSQASPDTRAKIEQLHNEAVKVALDYVEKTAGETRRGKGGKRIESAKLIFALFEHGISRQLDPCLHTHCLLQNVAVRKDGTTGAVSSMAVLKARKTADAIYQSALRTRLESELGLETRPVRTWFELAAVPTSVCRHFSKRRAEIESALAESGKTSPKAVAAAAIQTRPAKEHVPRRELFKTWEAECDRLGWRSSSADFKQTPQTQRIGASQTDLTELSKDRGFFTRDELVRQLVLGTKSAIEATVLIAHAETIIEREAVPLGNGRFSVSAVGRTSNVPAASVSDLPMAIDESLELGRKVVIVHPNPPWEAKPFPNGVVAMPVQEFLGQVKDSDSTVMIVAKEILEGNSLPEFLKRYGPDLTGPVRNALSGLVTYLERTGPNLGHDIREIFARYGPDIGEIYRSIQNSLKERAQKELGSRTAVFVVAPEKMSARDLLAIEAACDLAGSRMTMATNRSLSRGWAERSHMIQMEAEISQGELSR